MLFVKAPIQGRFFYFTPLLDEKYFAGMLHKLTLQFDQFLNGKLKFWVPLLSGLLFSFCLPPFNHEAHWLLAPFPFLTFVALIPFFYFARQRPLKKALFNTYLYSYTMALGQFFWIAFVKIEGLWAIIILAMFVLAFYVALFYLAAAIAFRWLYKKAPIVSIATFPAVWILIDYSRTLGELGFPWEFLGYSLTPVLPLSQFASLTGVWGLTYLIVIGNMLVWHMSTLWLHRSKTSRTWVMVAGAFVCLVLAISIWGHFRMQRIKEPLEHAKIALLQPALDQLSWGNFSLETSFTVIDSMVKVAALEKPDFIIGPESSLLCYLARQSHHRARYQGWADSANTPLLLGAIDWEKADSASPYEYLVYNAAFLALPGKKKLQPYRKIKLVPFSEAFPFEADFPILSRVNLGESDFKRGKEETVFTINDHLKVAVYVCYEAIFPSFVQRRLKKGANLIVHITNDGWFGKTTGPYQHAIMSRMRAIENGVPIARCAITGISMFIDPVGRIIKQSQLDKRVILQHATIIRKADTFYARHGDWFIVFSAVVAVAGSVICAFFRKRSSAPSSPPTV